MGTGTGSDSHEISSFLQHTGSRGDILDHSRGEPPIACDDTREAERSSVAGGQLVRHIWKYLEKDGVARVALRIIVMVSLSAHPQLAGCAWTNDELPPTLPAGL